jgi:hypothetical protein
VPIGTNSVSSGLGIRYRQDPKRMVGLELRQKKTGELTRKREE